MPHDDVFITTKFFPGSTGSVAEADALDQTNGTDGTLEHPWW
jgi:hypothetical protein